MGDGQTLSGESSSDAYKRDRFIMTSHPDYHTELSMERDETRLIIHHRGIDFIDELVSPSPPPLSGSPRTPAPSGLFFFNVSSLHVTLSLNVTDCLRLTGVSVCRRCDRQRLGADLKCQQLLEGFLIGQGTNPAHGLIRLNSWRKKEVSSYTAKALGLFVVACFEIVR